jgi:hypothetical protein
MPGIETDDPINQQAVRLLEPSDRQRGLGSEDAVDPQRGGPGIELPLDRSHRVAPAAGADQDNESRPCLIANDPVNWQPSVPLEILHRLLRSRPKFAVDAQTEAVVPQQILDGPNVFTA